MFQYQLNYNRGRHHSSRYLKFNQGVNQGVTLIFRFHIYRYVPLFRRNGNNQMTILFCLFENYFLKEAFTIRDTNVFNTFE